MSRARENAAVIAMTVGLPEAWKLPASLAGIAIREDTEEARAAASESEPTQSTRNDGSPA